MHCSGPDLAPMPSEDAYRPHAGDQGGDRHWARPNPADVLDRGVQESVRVENMKHDEENIEALGLLVRLLVPKGLEFVEKIQTALGHRLLNQPFFPEKLLVLHDQGE